MMPMIGVLEPLTECLAIGLLGCWGAYHLWEFNIWLFLLCHCLFWFVADQSLLHIMQGVSAISLYHQSVPSVCTTSPYCQLVTLVTTISMHH